MRSFTPAVGDEVEAARIGRRTAIATALFLPSAVLAQDILRRGSPQLTLGPFYPVDRGRDDDFDLTRIQGQARAKGQLMEVSGRVLDESANPVPGTRIEVWQTNGLGAYHHAGDESGIPRDPGFQGFARLTTDADGRYRIRTVMPRPYGRRQRHIHFDVSGRNRRLITQMFFDGEPNERDSLFPAIPTPVQKTMATARRGGQSEETGAEAWQYDIVLAGEVPRPG